MHARNKPRRRPNQVNLKQLFCVYIVMPRGKQEGDSWKLPEATRTIIAVLLLTQLSVVAIAATVQSSKSQLSVLRGISASLI